MTLTQLEAFVLVARLGSVKAAARVLGVSEPAVSGALAALRKHLGDPLVAATAHGMELTPGGQRLVGIASQMVNLGAEPEAAIRHAQGAPEKPGAPPFQRAKRSLRRGIARRRRDQSKPGPGSSVRPGATCS